MKVNDYVRYKYENCIYIGKIKFISEVMGFEETLQLDIDTCMEEILKENIIKSSPNIIDLIEVGDYVNGLKITYIDEPDEYNSQRLLYFEYPIDYVIKTFCNEDIKSIVTKECFKSMEYKVKE